MARSHVDKNTQISPTDTQREGDRNRAYNREATTKDGPLKVVAGSPDRPLVIGSIEIPCYVLENEARVLVQRGVATGMGMSSGSGARIGRFASAKNINSFLNNEIRAVIDNPIKFSTPKGIAHGYPASLLVDLCNAVLAAREAGALQKQQAHIAQRCEVLIRGFATVGIIALVDEATGYQRIREERALASILEQWITKEHERWTRTFPYEFYKEIFRLKGWPGPQGTRRPSLIGLYTNNIVYQRLAPGRPRRAPGKEPHLA